MNNMKLIKLHNSNDNSAIIVNYDLIICIDTYNKDNKRMSKIYLNTNLVDNFTVNETPEKIYSMIETNIKNSTSNN